MNRIVILLIFISSLAGCGRKGDLIPPEALVPASVTQLQVEQQGTDLRLSWQGPAREQSGRPLRDLAGFRLLRRDLAADGSGCASCPDSWQLLANVDPDLPGETKRSGATFIHFDRERPLGSASQYRLVAFSKSGGVSLPVTSPVKRVQPPVPAPAISASLLKDGIAIAFNFSAPAGTKLLGYRLYRRQADEAAALLPLTAAPITTTTWEDRQLQYDRRYRYSATALVESGGEQVESFPAAEVELHFTLQELR